MPYGARNLIGLRLGPRSPNGSAYAAGIVTVMDEDCGPLPSIGRARVERLPTTPSRCLSRSINRQPPSASSCLISTVDGIHYRSSHWSIHSHCRNSRHSNHNLTRDSPSQGSRHRRREPACAQTGADTEVVPERAAGNKAARSRCRR